jgi:hypothetical protein
VTGAPFESRFERLELKYVIDEGTAGRVRRAIEPYCTPDAHNRSAGSTAPGYPVRSLYLDTPSLAFHHAKARGEPERFKLRMRRYRGLEAVSQELKRRSSDVVEKTRVLFCPDELRDAAHGLAKPLEDTPEARRLAARFARLTLSTGAEPSLLVRYDREAYSSEVDTYARVTFDRNIEFQRTAAWSLDDAPGAWESLEMHARADVQRPMVVLELKCTTSVPAWLVDVIRQHELRRDSVSKYSLGIYLTRRIEGIGCGQERARGMLR